MSDITPDEIICADCGRFEIGEAAIMYQCARHKTEYCRGCSCPFCAEDLCDEPLGVEP